jgi:pyochelin biosynthesis protein PchC
MTEDPSSWFRRYRPVSEPRLRLVCFPHAGGAASAYRAWPPLLPGDVELLAVQYPGRQDRLDERCLTSMDQLADAVAEALAPFLDRPLALFGHSMGASVAHEVALRLERRHGPVLHTLLVSARLPPRHHRSRDSLRDDQALLADVRTLDPANSAILEDPGIREVIFPSIRADYRIIDTYQPSTGLIVSTPVAAYVGNRDPLVSLWQMRAWSDVTKSGFDTVVFPGGHFYLRSHEVSLVGDVARRLADAVHP